MKPNNIAFILSCIILPALLLPGCFLVSFRQIRYTTYPAEVNQVIPIKDALYIEFDISVEKTAAEKNIKLMKASQVLSGDLSWEANRLLLQPVPDLTPGTRYAFTYKGQVESEFGEIFSIYLEIPFYAGSSATPPLLTAYTPQQAAETTVTTALTFTFSNAIASASFDEGFTLSPITEFDTTWNANGTLVTITPRQQWKPLTYYNWQVTDAITDTDGIPLAYAVDGGFLTQADSQPPRVISILPGALTLTGFLPLPGDLNNLTKTDVILLTFSEDIQFQSLSTAFSLTPSINGNLQRIEAASFAFVPEEGFVMNTQYTLKIDNECRDLAGIAIGTVYETTFTPDIPSLLVTEIRNLPVLADFTPATFNQSAAYQISYGLPGNTHTFTFVFNEPIDTAAREQVSGGISCRTFFPPGISTLYFALQNVSWNISGTELSMTWTGFANSPDISTPYYYELTIPSGENNTANSAGSFLEQEIRVLLEAPVL